MLQLWIETRGLVGVSAEGKKRKRPNASSYTTLFLRKPKITIGIHHPATSSLSEGLCVRVALCPEMKVTNQRA